MLDRAHILLVLGLTVGCADRSVGDEQDEEEADPEIERRCAEGCVAFSACMPTDYAARYADDAACRDDCAALFSAPAACRDAAIPYSACTAGLPCEQWPDLLRDPATTTCAAQWDLVAPACGL